MSFLGGQGVNRGEEGGVEGGEEGDRDWNSSSLVSIFLPIGGCSPGLIGLVIL